MNTVQLRQREVHGRVSRPTAWPTSLLSLPSRMACDVLMGQEPVSINALEWSPSARLLVSAGDRCHVDVWTMPDRLEQAPQRVPVANQSDVWYLQGFGLAWRRGGTSPQAVVISSTGLVRVMIDESTAVLDCSGLEFTPRQGFCAVDIDACRDDPWSFVLARDWIARWDSRTNTISTTVLPGVFVVASRSYPGSTGHGILAVTTQEPQQACISYFDDRAIGRGACWQCPRLPVTPHARSPVITTVGVSPSGRHIAALATHGDAYVYTVDSDAGRVVDVPRRLPHPHHRNFVTLKTVSWAGNRCILTGSDTGHVCAWDVLSSDTATIGCRASVTNHVRAHPSLPFVATAGVESTVGLWRPSSSSDTSDGGGHDDDCVPFLTCKATDRDAATVRALDDVIVTSRLDETFEHPYWTGEYSW